MNGNDIRNYGKLMLLGKASFQGQKHYDFPTTLFTKVNLQFCLKNYHEKKMKKKNLS